MLSIRYPMEVNLQGDSAATLRALIPLLQRKTDRAWREEIEKGVAQWWKVLEGRAMNKANPINPQRVFWELSPRLPDNCILSSDSGSAANWYARDVKIRRGMMASLSGNLATMGPGVPYAIVAKFAYPDRVVVAMVGDCAMQMNGMNELITIGKYWKRWADPRLVVLVLNNRDLNQVTWELLGAVRDGVPIYGSGGFTSYSIDELQRQLSGWSDAGISRVKMKIGRDPEQDIARACAARDAIGSGTELFVDANGAYGRKQALSMTEAFADFGVSWFEEPVSSDDLIGLRLLRDRAPPGMAIAAGEYGYDLHYFQRMLEAGAVDVPQANATRCGGITDFLKVNALYEARAMPLSSHCAPMLHLHPCCACASVRHMEYFYDHVRIATMLFDGVPAAADGKLYPDASRPGLGLEFKNAAQRYAI